MKKRFVLIFSMIVLTGLWGCNDSHHSKSDDARPPVLSDGDMVSFTLTDHGCASPGHRHRCLFDLQPDG